ncbi:hypothetical protein AHAS_Ahas20G0164900 [Arachis hypogaea]
MLRFSSILNSSISLGGNLTMVDLPGITRVPVHGQPENIYDQIKDIIMEYIRPEESIILNVLSATVDFTSPLNVIFVVEQTGKESYSDFVQNVISRANMEKRLNELEAAKSEIQSWHSSIQNEPCVPAGATPEPKMLLDFLQALKSSEESLREQLEKAKKKEAAFIVTFAKREQEIAELKIGYSKVDILCSESGKQRIILMDQESQENPSVITDEKSVEKWEAVKIRL